MRCGGQPRIPGWWLVVAAAVAIVAAGVLLAVGPMVATAEVAVSVPGSETVERGPRAHGLGWASAVVFAGVPLLIVSPAILLRRRRGPAVAARAAAAALLTVFVLLAAMSVGLFFAPAAVLMLLATVLAGFSVPSEEAAELVSVVLAGVVYVGASSWHATIGGAPLALAVVAALAPATLLLLVTLVIVEALHRRRTRT